MLFHGSLFPCLLLLAELSPAPACQDISRSRPYFSFCPSHTCPAFSLGPLGPSLDTLILQLVESHRSDCWAGLKLRLPQILPPPTVTAAASSALPRALCSPLTSSSSSFSRSSSLGCGQTQRVSGSPGSPQPLLPPPPCQRTPQVLLRGGIARPLCHIGVGGGVGDSQHQRATSHRAPPKHALRTSASPAPTQGLGHTSRRDNSGPQPGLGCGATLQDVLPLQGAHGCQADLSSTLC